MTENDSNVSRKSITWGAEKGGLGATWTSSLEWTSERPPQRLSPRAHARYRWKGKGATPRDAPSAVTAARPAPRGARSAQLTARPIFSFTLDQLLTLTALGYCRM